MELKFRQPGIDRAKAITDLFSSTIKAVNSADYNPHQIMIWSSGNDISVWRKKISEQYFITAEHEGKLVGFASLAIDGLVDMFFVHKDFQRKGIGSQLLKEIEKNAIRLNIKRLYAEVSITAKPFFESQGFKLIKVFIKTFKETEFEDNLMEKYL